MKRNLVLHLAMAICIGTTASSTYAHHSYGAFFDLCTSVTIEGRIDRIEWKNPHVWIDLTTDGGAYRAEWTSLQGLSNRGVTTDALKAGDRVAVTGSPMRDPASIRDPAVRALMPDPASASKVVSALTQIRRVSDGWSWTGSDGMPPPECGRK